jgi:hypothetical protein
LPQVKTSGLKDRYAEGIMSKLVGTFGGTRNTTVDPRYQRTLMAVTNGVLESQNLSDLASENQPSPTGPTTTTRFATG